MILENLQATDTLSNLLATPHKQENIAGFSPQNSRLATRASLPPLLALNKPSGFSTHAPDPQRPGIIEIASQALDYPLITVHRLDKGTSGCLLVATDSKTAADVSALFVAGLVQKQYDFLATHRTDNFENQWVEIQNHNDQLERTLIEYVGTVGSYHHYRAFPQTGRTHQIRKAAQHLGISILGDIDYGGKPFLRLMLHASRIEVPGFGVWKSPLPCAFQRHTVQDPLLLKSYVALERRLEMSKLDTQSNCFRRIHSDGDPLRMDQYGSISVFYWYGDPQELEVRQPIFDQLARRCESEHWWARAMQNRGADATSNQLVQSGQAPIEWVVTENNCKFEIRADKGLSFGLFLDQKNNRKWVQKHSQQKRVLNLFCYTGGFSVAALAGGAAQVDSIDVSRAYGQWTERNLKLNALQGDRHRFYSFDVRDFLKWAAKKQLFYDLIVLDPPSFGRSDKGIFRIEKDLPELIQSCARVLNADGKLLLTCNYEKWEPDDIEDLVRHNWPTEDVIFEEVPPSFFDYELPGEPSILKTVIISSHGVNE